MTTEPSSRGLRTTLRGWARVRRLLQRLRAPIDKFLHVQASGGLVLMLAAAIALAWASSPFGASYQALWQHRFVVQLGARTLDPSLHFLVDEGLMTLFFFVVGLEIKRELHDGELSEWRRAVIPVAAALGGMIAPALIYLALNGRGPQRLGWGIPVATDIAFAVGVLALLGKRVPPALRVLLLALAIIDDIGAIIVIAIFYSAGVSLVGALIVAAGVALVLVLQRARVRSPWVYLVPGVVVWAGTLRMGVHPTIAGVAVGLLTPVTPVTTEPDAPSPAVRLGGALHPWVAYGIMPLFALANAGVPLRASTLRLDQGALVPLGIVLGLVLGKPIGILVATGLVTRLRLGTLPRGIGASSLLVLGSAAGIGFTMSIFIAGLAFTGTSTLEVAKLAVLAASVLSGIIAFIAGRLLLPRELAPGAARTALEAERSTDV